MLHSVLHAGCITVCYTWCCRLYYAGCITVSVCVALSFAYHTGCIGCVLLLVSVTVLHTNYYTGCIGCLLQYCILYYCYTLWVGCVLQCCKLLPAWAVCCILYWLHRLYQCITVCYCYDVAMLGWVLLLYSLHNHRVCVTVLQTILASVDCVLQCCKLYWLHGIAVNTCWE